MGDGEKVENRIGRTAERDGDGDRIFQRLFRNDIRGADAAFQQIVNGGAGISAVGVFLRGYGVLRGAIWKAETQGLNRRRHGVRRIHAPTGSWPGNGIGLHIMKFFAGDFIHGALTDRLEDRDDIQLPLRQASRLDRAAIHKNRGPIHPGHRHDTSRHVFIASADRHKSIEALTPNNRLDRVGDDLPRDERVFHSGSAHRDAVRDRDGIEDRSLAASCIHTQRGFAGELVDVHIARRDHAPGRGNADLGFCKIALLVSDRIEHRAARRTAETIKHDRRKGTHGGVIF